MAQQILKSWHGIISNTRRLLNAMFTELYSRISTIETDTTHYGGMTYISTEGTQTIATGGTFEKLFEGAMAYTAAHLDSFTHSNGRLTYASSVDRHFDIQVHTSIESDEASARVQIRIALNGTTIAATDVAHDFRATDTDAVLSTGWLMNLTTGDYIEVFGTSDTNGDTFVVHNLTLVITEM